MSLEILSWNILSGGFKNYGSLETRPSRIETIVSAIKKIKPDLVSLIDTYRWTEIFSTDELKQLFEYPVVHMVKLEDQRLITKGHDNGIAVFSKNPDAKMSPVWLGTRNAIKTHLAGIDIFSVYFDDVSEEARVKQTQAVLKLVDPKVPTIIIGDLNTFSEKDLEQTSRSLNKLGEKHPEAIKVMDTSLKEMKKCKVTQLLSENGFFDLGQKAGYTVPAKLFPVPTEKPIIRLDYAFANEKIKLADFKVLTDEGFGNLSDHYPIWLKISIK